MILWCPEGEYCSINEPEINSLVAKNMACPIQTQSIPNIALANGLFLCIYQPVLTLMVACLVAVFLHTVHEAVAEGTSTKFEGHSKRVPCRY